MPMTEIQKIQAARASAIEKSIAVLLKGALKRWSQLPPSLQIRKLRALSNLLARDLGKDTK